MFRFLKESNKSSSVPARHAAPAVVGAAPLQGMATHGTVPSQGVVPQGAGVKGLAPQATAPQNISHHGYSVTTRLGAERTAVPAGLTVVGQLAYDSPVRIDGKLEGSLFSSASVVISEQGAFTGSGTIRDFEVRGECNASLQVLGRLKICKGARFSGSLAIRSENLIVEEGAIVNADCRYLAA
jgi:cytoskeletal protein CcmA (bactofilin family)